MIRVRALKRIHNELGQALEVGQFAFVDDGPHRDGFRTLRNQLGSWTLVPPSAFEYYTQDLEDAAPRGCAEEEPSRATQHDPPSSSKPKSERVYDLCLKVEEAVRALSNEVTTPAPGDEEVMEAMRFVGKDLCRVLVAMGTRGTDSERETIRVLIAKWNDAVAGNAVAS